MSKLRDRIVNGMSLATGVQQHTPQDQFFIETNAVGRWQTDFDAGAQQPAYIHRRHPDGTVDTIRAHARLDNTWLEMGGLGARDVAVGRI